MVRSGGHLLDLLQGARGEVLGRQLPGQLARCEKAKASLQIREKVRERERANDSSCVLSCYAYGA